jgi:hypothetical protein
MKQQSTPSDQAIDIAVNMRRTTRITWEATADSTPDRL